MIILNATKVYMSSILFSIEEGVGYITLNRPDKLNSFNREMALAMQQKLDPALPSLLAAHLYVSGSAVRGLFRLSEVEDILFQDSTFSAGWSYVALGHIHQPMTISGMSNVRYSGSIERMDQGEREDDKSVTLIDIGPAGLRSELPSTWSHRWLTRSGQSASKINDGSTTSFRQPYGCTSPISIVTLHQHRRLTVSCNSCAASGSVPPSPPGGVPWFAIVP